MPTIDTSEKALEALIADSLVNEAGYVRGDPKDYDREFCIDRKQLFAFLQATQPQTAAKLGLAAGGSTVERFLKRLSDQITKRGIVDVLRKGMKDGLEELTLYYPRPASALNPKAAANYAANVFSVTRQVRFSADVKNRSLDLALFLNGLPLATFELKNRLTSQNVKDAIVQYQGRDAREPLFAFARCLVHFAVDDDLVYMTTHLRGPDTTFLPFNKGRDGGAGNPVNPHGLKTDYLWKSILAKDSLANIVEKYAQVVEETDAHGQKRKKLVFPRYHQLDLVLKQATTFCLTLHKTTQSLILLGLQKRIA